mgnify:CR=1 FL=1
MHVSSAGQIQRVRFVADHDDGALVRKRLQQHAFFFLAFGEENARRPTAGARFQHCSSPCRAPAAQRQRRTCRRCRSAKPNPYHPGDCLCAAHRPLPPCDSARRRFFRRRRRRRLPQPRSPAHCCAAARTDRQATFLPAPPSLLLPLREAMPAALPLSAARRTSPLPAPPRRSRTMRTRQPEPPSKESAAAPAARHPHQCLRGVLARQQTNRLSRSCTRPYSRSFLHLISSHPFPAFSITPFQGIKQPRFFLARIRRAVELASCEYRTEASILRCFLYLAEAPFKKIFAELPPCLYLSITSL